MTDLIRIFIVSCGAVGVMMLFPALLAVSNGYSKIADAFFLPAGIIVFISVGGSLALRRHETINPKLHIKPVARIGLLFSLWVFLPLLASLPFVFSASQNILNAYFEAVSGMTTTGATIYHNLNNLEAPLVLWRALLQWLGIILSITGIILVFAPLAMAGIGNQYSAYIDLTGSSFFWIYLRCSGFIALIATILALAATLLLKMSGLSFFEAFCLALTAISTGGFLPYDQPLNTYVTPGGALIMAFFMLLGALSIFLPIGLVQAVTRVRWNFFSKTHNESLLFLLATAVIALGYFVILWSISGSSGDLSWWLIIVTSIFSAISVASTSGINYINGGITVLPIEIVIPLIFIGGTAFSSAGGIKWFRMRLLIGQSVQELNKLLYPNWVAPAPGGDNPGLFELQQAVASVFCVSLAVIAFSALLVAPSTGEFTAGIAAAVSAFTSAGPIYEAGWSIERSWPGYAEFLLSSKLVLIITMILGRVETLILFALLSRRYWR